jgi:GT2 family glycosyltransferase
VVSVIPPAASATSSAEPDSVSVIVPTIGRATSLRRMLHSLCEQTFKVQEVIVADGSATIETAVLVADDCWRQANLCVKRVAVQPPNAVRQREAAIAEAGGEYLLLLDDDVVLEPDCVQQMIRVVTEDAGVVGVFADFNNQSWPMPTRAWRFYLRHVLGLEDGTWQGRVIGPLLHFGYNPSPKQAMPIEWLGTCNTLVRRCAYEQVGGFSNFFLHRCTILEDVDLGLRIAGVGRLMFCPTAKMAHLQAPGGRVSQVVAAEDDLYNRYLVMRCTQKRSWIAAFGSVFLYFAIETASNLGGCVRRFRGNGFGSRLSGRLHALGRIISLQSQLPNS